MKLSTQLSELKGVGPKTAMIFKRLGLDTVSNLLEYYPRKYEDYSKIQLIGSIKPGPVTIKVKIKQVSGKYIRGGLHITEAVASDDTGSVRLVWFNQPYRSANIKRDEIYFVSGLFELRNNRLSITNPSMELESAFPLNTARIVPIYKETKGLSSNQIRKILKTILTSKLDIPETLPIDIIKSEALVGLLQAIKTKHFPESLKDLKSADERLGFEELFELILASQYAKQDLASQKGLRIPFDRAMAKEFVKHLPFTLTDAQKKAVWQIYQDMDSEKVMNRMLEGDVGAGKTVVATMSAVMALAKNYQVAFMAPTDLLARQHAETIFKLLKPLGLASKSVLLVGSMSAKEKAHAHETIKTGQALFIIGTHALIQDKVDLQNLALVIVDEQHRFGVDQRKKLLAKAGHAPHMLSMTATPIPRSLALTVFGELDISILDQKPKNRLPIITELVNPTNRIKLYDKIQKEIDKGKQIFVVCPLIEESDMLQAKSAQKTYLEMQIHFKKSKVGLLHGKLKPDEKQATMQAVIDGSINILVATTVIEVGVDVPNATIMLIEAPERFGLAQLHQLRGRVGRGNEQGYCYLMLSDSVALSRRLRAIESTDDGFKLAELDLEIRGAGALYGTMQHGQLDLRIANFSDTKLIARARNRAVAFSENPDNLLQYPYIKQRISELQSVVHLN
jgi:ATP-dependent DNA helicase RecG